MPQLSLDDLMQVRAPWTYLVRIEAESVLSLGMYSGDLLVVDRSVEAMHGNIAIEAVIGEPTYKRTCRQRGVLILRSVKANCS